MLVLGIILMPVRATFRLMIVVLFVLVKGMLGILSLSMVKVIVLDETIP